MTKKTRKCPAKVTLVPNNQNMIKTIRTERVASNGGLKYLDKIGQQIQILANLIVVHTVLYKYY